MTRKNPSTTQPNLLMLEQTSQTIDKTEIGTMIQITQCFDHSPIDVPMAFCGLYQDGPDPGQIPESGKRDVQRATDCLKAPAISGSVPETGR